MRLPSLVALSIAVVAVAGLSVRTLAQSPTYGVGRPPTAAEERAWDIAISPTGKELPDGRGSAVEGARLYVQKGCAGCHGAQGSGNRAPILIKRVDESTPMNSIPCLVPCIRDATVMALHSPYATVIWDYINRGMPLGREGSLKSDEVYALTAFLLFKNGVIKETDVLDRQSLPKVVMPNKDGAAAAPEWKPKTPRLVGYP
jgi:S-disulfanyl-L-cysteine oxidoreductase SoxD